MKILVVSNMYPSATDPSYGTFVRNFVEALSETYPGAVGTCVIRGRRKGKVAKVFAYAGFYTRLLSRALFGHYDLIYVHTVTFPTPALRVAAALRRLPLVFNVHGDDVLPSNGFKRRLRDMCAPLLRRARMIVAPSEYFRGVVLNQFSGLDPERVIVSASGGVAEPFFHKPRREPNAVPVIGFVSRIDTDKGWDTYIEALAILRREGVALHGVMAGGGAQESLLQQAVDRAGVRDCVDFTGPLSQADLANLYPTFDLFVFPSRRPAESLGLVGLEAMASGVPVVACAMAGPTSYVEDGVNGYLFEPGNARALADKIKAYLSLDEREHRQMKRAAQDTALQYSAPAVHARLMSALRQIL